MLTLDNCITDKEYEVKTVAAIEPYKSRLTAMGITEGVKIVARHRGGSGAVVQVGEMKLALSKKLTRKILLSRITEKYEK